MTRVNFRLGALALLLSFSLMACGDHGPTQSGDALSEADAEPMMGALTLAGGMGFVRMEFSADDVSVMKKTPPRGEPALPPSGHLSRDGNGSAPQQSEVSLIGIGRPPLCFPLPDRRSRASRSSSTTASSLRPQVLKREPPSLQRKGPGPMPTPRASHFGSESARARRRTGTAASDPPVAEPNTAVPGKSRPPRPADGRAAGERLPGLFVQCYAKEIGEGRAVDARVVRGPRFS